MHRIPILLAFSVAMASGASHVRVILDDSGSMVHNDSARLAPNAVVLLYDLVSPNTTKPGANADSFEVRTLENRHRFSAAEGRPEFVKKITGVKYDNARTLYYPSLVTAIDELKAIPVLPTDRRVIVLVTDGKPEDPKSDLDKIRTDFVPLLAKYAIRLYVLAIGPAAGAEKQAIQRLLGGTSVGDYLDDPTGTHMLDRMIEIFSRSFGYTSGKPVEVGSALPLDLEGNESPEQVAVVSYWLKGTPPEFTLTPPRGQGFNHRGYLKSNTSGSSFTMTWALTPGKGSYTLQPRDLHAIAAILRPVQTRISVEPRPSGNQIDFTMAQIRLPMRVVARAASARTSPPADAELSFTSGGPIPGRPDWTEKPQGPDSTGPLPPDATYYDIAPVFQEPSGQQDRYEGWVDVELRKGEAVIARARHLVTVYPFLRLSPYPPSGDAAIDRRVRALERRESGCASFDFHVTGRLPHSSNPVYLLQALVDKSVMTRPEFDGARLTLDGTALDLDGRPGPNPSDWTKGRSLAESDRTHQLAGPHEVCVQIGHVTTADPRTPIRVPILFRLQETPYNTQGALVNFEFNVLVAPPGWWEQWSAWLALLLGFLSCLLLLWYGRFRPVAPPNLQSATGRAGATLTPFPLGPGKLYQRLFGLIVERPVSVDGSRVLGWLRPVRHELYVFKPALASTRVLPPEDGGRVERLDGHDLLHVYRTYRAVTPEGEYLLRLAYS